MKEKPMKSILYVVHGSQIPEKNAQLADLLIKVGQETATIINLQEIAYLERQTDTIEIVAERLIEKGTSEILVVPVLLFPAIHTLVDIPNELAFIAEKYPHVQVTLLKNFGDEQPIFEILSDKVAQITSDEVILLAHGTRHFAESSVMLETIARNLSEKTSKIVRAVDYLGKGNYDKAISENLENNISQTVIPFFLYDGDLVKKRIHKSVWAIDPTIAFTTPLNFDSRMITALADIIRERKQYDTDFIRLT
ncbi:cobalamin biosynthesis protein CbiX [Lactococcus hodotermopsidis]|uniref:Cobalamin biosynthesis protein CbiX n=1 Tax=Pseudolactococcus hodotermopsidis TaxID=2709157 RepID=A0A6A0BBG1_9LACT|nr:sirohydrochlorin chelatase [Lactococcus hodotermopsidis]GFH41734.1 cobalamin biosynthesis protein CbiX [Lactococcus hodotermopsidis]